MTSGLEVFDQLEWGDALLRQADDRRFIYADLESILYSNRLSTAYWLGETALIFSTITPCQSAVLEARCRGDFEHWKQWYLASHLWMVGAVVLEGSQSHYVAFHSFFKECPRPYVEIFYQGLKGLFNRVERSGKVFAAYCGEPYSLTGWKSSPTPSDPHPYRALWDMWNEDEKRRDADTRQWGHTRTIVSSMTAKGARHLLQVEKKHQTEEQTHRVGLVEEAVNFILKGEKKEQEPITLIINGEKVSVPTVHSAHTIDELHEQMMQHMRGERDLHDRAVMDYRQRILAVHNERQEKAYAERMSRAQKEGDVSATTTMVGYTSEQLEELRPSLLTPHGMRPVSGSSEAVSHLISRYLEHDPLRPAQVGASGKPEVASSRQEDNSSTLQERIANRNPVFHEK